MFEQTMLVGTGRTGRPWTVPLSFAGQIVAVGLLVMVPLAFTEKLPFRGMAPSAPLRWGGAPKPKPDVVKVIDTKIIQRTGISAPTLIPKGTPKLVDPPPTEIATNAAEPCIGFCGEGGIPVGLPQGIPTSAMDRVVPPPVVQPRTVDRVKTAEPKVPVRMRIGGDVQDAKLVNRVLPVYPVMAVRTRTSGVVQLAAIIGSDGRIRELKVVSGHPMLIQAAVEAVRQWVYRPTLLNGDPVEVSTEIVVHFNFGRN